jgi:hypothetical protein
MTNLTWNIRNKRENKQDNGDYDETCVTRKVKKPSGYRKEAVSQLEFYIIDLISFSFVHRIRSV